MTAHPFTPSYIAMAKAAEEIQAMRSHSPPGNPRFSSYEIGDALLYDNTESIGFIGDLAFDQEDGQMELDEFSGEPVYPVAWLPRLDQLLGMLGKPMAFMYAIENHHRDWFDNYHAGARGDWHELGLAVVMREKYGKAWREGKWVKASVS